MRARGRSRPRAALLTEHVDAAEALAHLSHHVEHGIAVADIALDGVGVDAERAYLGDCRVGALLAARVVDGDGGALARELSAIALPMPRVPPVMRATLPSNRRNVKRTSGCGSAVAARIRIRAADGTYDSRAGLRILPGWGLKDAWRW